MQNTIAATMTRTLLRRHAPYAATATLAALLGLSSVIAQAIPTAHASALSVRYTRGYSVQGGWLCYGWSNGAYHCTQHWRGSSGHYVSLNPSWVPSEGSATTSATDYRPLSAPTAPKGISQWAITGLYAYSEPYGIYQGYSWGWCTSGAAMLTRANLRGLGNAVDWTRNAAARGMATGYTPRVGATVVYQPGIQGASSGGHVGHVYAVFANGWFISEDVNFTFAGGGFGKVSFRYAHTGPGVSFIYG